MVNVSAQVAGIHKKVDVAVVLIEENGGQVKTDCVVGEVASMSTRQKTILGIKLFLLFALLHMSLYIGAYITDFGEVAV